MIWSIDFSKTLFKALGSKAVEHKKTVGGVEYVEKYARHVPQHLRRTFIIPFVKTHVIIYRQLNKGFGCKVFL